MRLNSPFPGNRFWPSFALRSAFLLRQGALESIEKITKIPLRSRSTLSMLGFGFRESITAAMAEVGSLVCRNEIDNAIP